MILIPTKPVRLLASAAACALALAVLPPSALAQKTDDKKPALSAAEVTYLQQIARANLGEIVMSYLALEKSASEDVKEHARGMISGHGKSMQMMMEMVSKHGAFISLEPDLASYQKLLSEGGADFDKVYASEAQRINQEAIDNLNGVMGQISSDDVKSFAQDDLKEDKEHLKKAQDLGSKLK